MLIRFTSEMSVRDRVKKTAILTHELKFIDIRALRCD